MSKVVDSFTGEGERKAGKQAVKELQKGRDAVSRLTEESRGLLPDLFGQAQDSRRSGLQGALDVFGESIPLQAQTAQGGNVAAQETLLAGLPQIQNAILGRPTDLSGLQPTRLPFELNFSNAQLPEAQPMAGAPADTQLSAEQIMSMLSGGTR